MRVLVTGGCGFVGSSVVRLAVERGDHVLNVDLRRRSSPTPALNPIAARPGYARLEANVADQTLLRAVIREFAPDAVIHLAATPEAQTEGLIETETGMATALLEACRTYMDTLAPDRRERFRAVYLERAEPDTRTTPTRHEAARAVAATVMDRWSQARGIPLVTCVAGEAFGPWQSQTSFLARLVGNLLNEQPVSLANAGEDIRDWVPIRDLAEGLLLAAAVGPPQSRIDLSVGVERRDIDMTDFVCALLDERIPRTDGPWINRVTCTGDAVGAAIGPMLDAAEAERDLGWRPQGFHAGLDRLLTWALASRAASRARAMPVAAE